MSLSTSSDTAIRNDYDGPWKEILESYFEECMAFFFPDVHSAINWSKGYVFLDKELQQITREAEIGKRVADKLVKVWTLAGKSVWILVHIEIQGQKDKQFESRMYTYNYRLYDQFQRPVVSFAILSDKSPSWRPQQFSTDMWGCSVDFKFRTVKLLDYKGDWEALLKSKNPFAIVVMAHLKAIETAKNNLKRKDWKLTLIKMLYQRGYDREDIIKLLRFIDWLIALPPELESALWQDIRIYQQETKMPYITSFERIATEKGLEQGEVRGMRRSVQLVLETKFGAQSSELLPLIAKISKAEQLEILLERIVGEQLSFDDVRALVIRN